MPEKYRKTVEKIEGCVVVTFVPIRRKRSKPRQPRPEEKCRACSDSLRFGDCKASAGRWKDLDGFFFSGYHFVPWGEKEPLCVF